ncbi:hypothetical protein [Azospirillum sp.]|uniref:hypothetical protein n=1 Tax=Azospirillum sp. TaxID=34012 RepID=UPI003D742FF0
METIPAPGSTAALHQGCRCPIIENHQGKGRPQLAGLPRFVLGDGCPLHGEWYREQVLAAAPS